MITVGVFINGGLLVSRSAVNTTRQRDGKTVYRLDDGRELLHRPEDGAVALAKALLDTISLDGEREE